MEATNGGGRIERWKWDPTAPPDWRARDAARLDAHRRAQGIVGGTRPNGDRVVVSHQQHRRPHALAARVLDVAADLRDEPDVRVHLAAELELDLLEVLAHGLEDVGERHSGLVSDCQTQ